MKRLLLQLLLLGPLLLSAQDRMRQVSARVEEDRAAGMRFTPVRLLEAVPASPATDARWRGALRAATVLRYDAEAAAGLMARPEERIALELPGPAGMEVLELIRVDILAPGFSVRESATQGRADVPTGLHYRGMVRGVPGSLAAISIFSDELMGVIGDPGDDRVVGRFADGADALHVLYWESDLRGASGHVCAAAPPDRGYTRDELRSPGAAKSTRCVSIYWETAYDLFQNKGSVANVTAYATGLFNQMATLYDNDGVDVLLSELYVWNTASPYDATSSSGRLNQFGTVRTSFNGNLAHLIDLGSYGGVAWLNTLCSSTSLRMAYSGINTSYQNVPTYSWSVEVVTHETGHNLGSRHTHACVWNGDNTAIDGCGPAAGYSEGSCPQGPLPSSSVGGTIMSYCHLTSSTIKFANGFGPQPAALILNRVNSATCLAVCGTTCNPPTVSVTGITPTAATLNWANVGATSYTLRWRAVGAGTWTTVTGLVVTTYSLSGLTPGTAYEFQVMSVCGASSSAYSALQAFTTPVPCPDALEPNNSTGAAALVTLPASINALVASASDADYYRFTLASTSTISISLSGLAGDYDVRLLSSGGAQLAISQNGGTANEIISYSNATAGTYYVHVFGYGGAFSDVQCYLLYIGAIQACQMPQGLGSSAITWSSAQIGWSAVQGASGYDLRWKPASSGTWTTVAGLLTNSHALAGLSPLTSYEVQVRTLCAPGGSQGSASEWTATHAFTTLQAPCDAVPRSVVAARAFLEGPYRTATGLMTDSLRKLSLIPLTEPYTAMGHAVTGPTAMSGGLLATTGANAIVDWVLVELRSNASPYAVVEARAGLLQRDGDITAPDGVSPLGFCADAGTYRVAIRHRNHLGAMTAAGMALNGTAATVDLTLASTAAWGTGARKPVGSVMALWAGNTDPDATLRYTGEDNDRDPILSAIGGSLPTNTLSAYHGADVNMDGTVKYTGEGNDRDPILSNVGGSVPTSTLMEQLP